MAGANTVVEKYIGPGDVLLAYLPAAHILEFAFENACINWGAQMGYGNPKTLSDTSVRNCKGDIRELRPTVMVGVPAVWESVKKGIMAKVEAGGGLTKKVFWGAVWAKDRLLQYGLPGADLLDAVVFKKVKDATGGRLRICLSGGGPIAKETQRFLSLTITPMLNGYGLTETCAMGVVMDPRHWTDKAMGDLTGSIEVKLVDFADASYFVTNKPNPQGEIWIRGAPVMAGYYNDEEQTKEALTPDGWFKTGDIGEFDHNGHLKVIDRKKNLVKTLNGEYIALEKLESVYRSAPIVQNICVYADAQQTKPVAIIVPVEAVLQQLAAKLGVAGNGIEDLSLNSKIQSAVLKELQQTGRTGGLSGIEIIEGVVLSDEEWTPQNVSLSRPGLATMLMRKYRTLSHLRKSSIAR